MSLSRAVSSSSGCHACISVILRPFISQLSGNGIRRSRPFATTSVRCLSRSTNRPRGVRGVPLPPADTEPGYDFLETGDSVSAPKSEPVSQVAEAILEPEVAQVRKGTAAAEVELESPSQPEPLQSEVAETSGDDLRASSESAQVAPIPWYLQVHQERQQTAPAEITAREALPDLPPNPPPLLNALLEYLSVTAGMDHLSLLDLRHLDPPPALGQNLIMLICTARSEKHLHVSADRFCRHLRREFGLRANADGLLGRNELKIKLRRKAKRMKMLANIGGREVEGNIDDGIRTGWICVTVGKIEAHPDDKYGQGLMNSAEEEKFVGFRDVKPGVNVVVQMFTESKRDEVDLETLWGGVLRTTDRNNAQADESLAFDEEGANVRSEDEPAQTITEATQSDSVATSSTEHTTSPVRQWNRPTPTQGDVFPPASNSPTSGQLRRLHTVGLRPS